MDAETLMVPAEEAGWLAESTERRRKIAALGRELLTLLGEDPNRPGLEGTPDRWARMWLEFADYADGNTDTTFQEMRSDQMIVVAGIRVWSFCEHHLLPFWCDLTMGYIAQDKVLGLSKFGRIARLYASRLQVQERLTGQIADHLVRATGSPHVAVLAEGEHTCMVMRGARAPHRMRNSVILGRFRDAPAVREEFFHLAGGHAP